MSGGKIGDSSIPSGSGSGSLTSPLTKKELAIQSGSGSVSSTAQLTKKEVAPDGSRSQTCDHSQLGKRVREDILHSDERKVRERELQEKMHSTTEDVKALSAPLATLGFNQVERVRGKAGPLEIRYITGQSASGTIDIVIGVKNAYTAGAQVLRNFTPPHAFPMGWSQACQMHICKVKSQKQFERQKAAIMSLSDQLCKNVKDLTMDLVWTSEMSGTVYVDKAYCPVNGLWYLKVSGNCNCFLDICTNSLIDPSVGLGYVEVKYDSGVKEMVAATGCALSSLRSILLRAQDEGLKVKSNTFDPYDFLHGDD